MEAFGLVTICYRTLSAVGNQDQLNRLTNLAESAIAMRVQYLSPRLEQSPELAKPSLEFLEQAVASLRFLSVSSQLVQTLTDFKNHILGAMSARRHRRDVSSDQEGKLTHSQMAMSLEIDAKNLNSSDSKEKRRAFFDQVRQFMSQICTEMPREPVVVGKHAQMNQTEGKMWLILCLKKSRCEFKRKMSFHS